MTSRVNLNLLSRFFVTFAFVSVVLTVSSLSASALDHAEYAVLIVIDGCRPEYLDLAPTPHIDELAKRGITYESAWVGQLPTNTPPGHATLGTGVFPARHHVVNFKWKDPETGKAVFPCRLKNIRAGALVDIIDKADVPGLLVSFKKVYPDAYTLAMSSVKPYAALGMGNTGADAILFTPTLKRHKGKEWGEEGIEIGQIRHFESLSQSSIPKNILDLINAGIKPYQNPGDFDRWVVDAFLVMFDRKRPRLSMLNLPETDETGHKCGGLSAPETMKPVIRNVDAQIGKIMEAYKAAGIFEKTLFVITADHGMDTNAFDVSVGSYVTAFLGIKDLPQTGLTTPAIWLRNASRAKAVATGIATMNNPGITGVFYKTSEADGTSYKNVSPLEDTSAEKAWHYLLNTVACDYSPDLFLRLRENAVIGRRFPLNKKGKHYQGTWGVQHIPLFISGPGVRKSVHSDMPARLVDLAPTVLALMGIQAEGMDGIVLADALASAPPNAVNAQKELGSQLQKFQKALKDLSRKDLGVVSELPPPGLWNSFWIWDLLAIVFLVILIVVLQKTRVPKPARVAGTIAGVLLLVASQVFFILILQRILEI